MTFKNKRVLVTGSSGMIGKELVELLKEQGALVKIADVKIGYDLRYFEECLELCTQQDYVFHLAGIKGNPKKTRERPVDFMGPMLQFDTNMIIAAQLKNVKGFLYTSSIAVENPQTDKYPAWAKMTGEMLCQAMHIQYPEGTRYCIVRPANVYGRYDNFDNPDAMVISSAIKKVVNGKLEMFGNGMQIRDFINAKDVAKGMIQAMEKMPGFPVNLCSGTETTIKHIFEIISKISGEQIIFTGDINRVMGDNYRVMNINWEFKPEVKLEDGIKEAYDAAKRV